MHCSTCQKRGDKVTGCLVLTKRFGEYKNCFAYSSDPDWEKKVKTDVERYINKDYRKRMKEFKTFQSELKRNLGRSVK